MLAAVRAGVHPGVRAALQDGARQRDVDRQIARFLAARCYPFGMSLTVLALASYFKGNRFLERLKAEGSDPDNYPTTGFPTDAMVLWSIVM